ncbi:MAG: beta-lactamase family protein [Firmicutes bacterium]|nr:beta-lactamase family protein [Candidatus Fermentithermobacillaceae bacterium]
MKHFETQFEKYMNGFLEETKAPGMAVAVVSGDEIVYSRGFGVRDLETGAPVTPETIFGVASVSKSFSCLAIMQLAEAGKLSPHDPVKKYLPAFDLPGGGGERVTIHHLMTHTAGIPPLPTLNYSIRGNTQKDDGEEPGEESFPRIDDFDQLMEYIRTGDYEVLGEPGKYLSYSNDSYGLMGAVIEQVTGQRFEDYMEENVLAPLDMRRSMYDLRDLLTFDNVTSLYIKDDEEVKYKRHWQVAPPFTACGWLKSTVLDLANYLRMYLGRGSFEGREILSPLGVETMVHPHAPYSRDRKYGYGFVRLDDYHGVTLIEHSGSLRGVASNIGFIPEKGLGVAVLSNLTGTPSSRAFLAAVNLLMGLPLDTTRSVYKKEAWPPETISVYTGTFKSGEGSTFKLSEKDGKLIATVDKKEYEVKRDCENLGTLYMNGQDLEVRFLRDSEGNVWAIGWGGRIIRKTSE